MMKKHYILYILLILLSVCREVPKDIDKTEFERAFYLVLNEILQSKFEEVALVIDQTEPLYRSVDVFHNQDYEPPFSDGILDVYDRIYAFKLLLDEKLIDNYQRDYTYDSIDSTRIIKIDSSRIQCSTISSEELQAKLSKKFEIDIPDIYEAFEALEKRYHTKCYLKAHTPVFNSDYTVAIISIDQNCGVWNAGGSIFFLKKEKGKWQIFDSKQGWAT